jgi:hypothetical protein
MDEQHMTKIVTQYSKLGSELIDEIKITRLPDWKSVFIETIDQIGRAVVLTEYKIDGKTIWAGYSSRSQTVYISGR